MTSEQRRIARLIAQAEWEKFWRYVGVACFETRDWTYPGSPDHPWPYQREFCWGLPIGTGIKYVTQGGRTLVDPSTWSKIISFVKGNGWRVRPRPAWLLAELRVAQVIGVPRNAGHYRLYFGPTRYRVPDFDPRLTIPLRNTLVEVKLTYELKWTSQLLDFVRYAATRGARLEIYTDAKLLPGRGSQFWEYYDRGQIILRRVP
jgi:hypothetical protein